MPERIELPVEGSDLWIGAMMYLCLLTYPQSTDQAKRERLYRAFCSYTVRAARHHRRLPKGGNKHHSDLLKSVPKQQMLNSLNFANRHILLRLLAAGEVSVFWHHEMGESADSWVATTARDSARSALDAAS
ncbi:MAG TPA: hypothetical protein VGD45_11765 [Steroidobacter sp.]|uniref:hypothetical protein n=1 Tax=Steroidobacter sp. TaxID=1978227 RepID=UPI002ED93E17